MSNHPYVPLTSPSYSLLYPPPDILLSYPFLTQDLIVNDSYITHPKSHTLTQP